MRRAGAKGKSDAEVDAFQKTFGGSGGSIRTPEPNAGRRHAFLDRPPPLARAAVSPGVEAVLHGPDGRDNLNVVDPAHY
jgi:hypothetical protein